MEAAVHGCGLANLSPQPLPLLDPLRHLFLSLPPGMGSFSGGIKNPWIGRKSEPESDPTPDPANRSPSEVAITNQKKKSNNYQEA